MTQQPQRANAGGAFGLYPAQRFRLVTGECGDCAAIRQALWYFRDQTIAVPLAGLPVAGFAMGVHAADDVRSWAVTRPSGTPIDYPPLVWVAAPDIVRGARLSEDASQLVTRDGALAFHPTARIPLNRSYYDASSVAFFRQREITARGTPSSDGFVARSLWPEDFRVGGAAPPARAMPAGLPPAEALRSLMREEPHGGAQSPYAASTLWQKAGMPADWAGRPVLAFMVNGAQGDDDEAHGGHFALVTGRVQTDGQIGDWLVNNFYSLDVESEKGIIAAPVPLDNYLADLNSGQGWYRPSYMVVAVLKDERAAVLVQSALNRVYNQFWRHQLVYYHPNDELHEHQHRHAARVGLERPAARADIAPAGVAGLSVPRAQGTLHRQGQARVRLPAHRPDAIDARGRAGGGVRQPARLRPTERLRDGSGQLAHMLAEDVDALAFVRFPQFPSSRAFGDAPAVTTWEYKALIPNDPAHQQIVPVPPRPFPEELRDPDLIPSPWRPSDYAVLVWGLLTVVGIPVVLWRLWRWRHMRRR